MIWVKITCNGHFKQQYYSIFLFDLAFFNISLTLKADQLVRAPGLLFWCFQMSVRASLFNLTTRLLFWDLHKVLWVLWVGRDLSCSSSQCKHVCTLLFLNWMRRKSYHLCWEKKLAGLYPFSSAVMSGYFTACFVLCWVTLKFHHRFSSRIYKMTER